MLLPAFDCLCCVYTATMKGRCAPSCLIGVTQTHTDQIHTAADAIHTQKKKERKKKSIFNPPPAPDGNGDDDDIIMDFPFKVYSRRLLFSSSFSNSNYIPVRATLSHLFVVVCVNIIAVTAAAATIRFSLPPSPRLSSSSSSSLAIHHCTPVQGLF